MEATPTAIKRARVRLLNKAEFAAAKDGISLSEAVLQIVEAGQDQKLIQQAFMRLPVNRSHVAVQMQTLTDYIEQPID